MKPDRPLALSLAQRHLLFQALARAEHASVPVTRALEPLRAESRGRLTQRLEVMQAALERGLPIGRAGRQAGLFTPWEGRVLESAANAGTLEAVLARLAEHHATRQHWAQQVRSRLALPLLLLVVMALVAPLPALVGQAIDGAGYLRRALLPLASLAALVYLLTRVARHARGQDLPRVLERLLLWLPGVGRMVRLRAQRDLLMNLALLLAAGRPAVEALREAAATVRSPGAGGRGGRSGRHGDRCAARCRRAGSARRGAAGRGGRVLRQPGPHGRTPRRAAQRPA